MQPNNCRADKSSGSRTARTNRIANAAKQLRLARAGADGWEAAALRALEADCYQLLTGGFQRASELRVDRGTGIETDGGRCAGDTERPDPTDDPAACSLCGCYIGQFSGDYCDGCAREIGVKPPLRRCIECGRDGPEENMVAIDVSPPDEYYPTFEYLCRGCSTTDTDRSEEADR